MKDIPDQWRAYLARQSELDQRGDTTSTSWGIEAGLNQLLEQPTSSTDLTKRAISAGARRSRYADALLAKYVTFGAYRIDGVAAMEARSTLEKIRVSLSPDTVAILVEAACGEDGRHMAIQRGITLQAFQTRLSRARSMARKLAA